MIRTSVYLPDTLHAKLKKIVAQKQLAQPDFSLSLLIRELLEAGVNAVPKTINEMNQAEFKAFLNKYTGLSGGNPDINSETIDEYLYGSKRKK